MRMSINVVDTVPSNHLINIASSFPFRHLIQKIFIWFAILSPFPSPKKRTRITPGEGSQFVLCGAPKHFHHWETEQIINGMINMLTSLLITSSIPGQAGVFRLRSNAISSHSFINYRMVDCVARTRFAGLAPSTYKKNKIKYVVPGSSKHRNRARLITYKLFLRRWCWCFCCVAVN